LNEVGGLFVDRQAEERMTELYREFLGAPEAPDFKAEERSSKRFVLDDLLGAELRRLTRLFQRVCASKRRHRDFATEELRRALREVIAAFPVYRTYLQPNSPHRSADVGYVREAVRVARADSAELDTELLDFLEELLSGNCLSELEWEFVLRFQQLSSAAMAKGLEDTAFYRYSRLVALNEVGGNPARFGTTLEDFHAFAARLQSRWPATLVTTSTHDTKRSQDARLRVAALSELGDDWGTAVRSWSALARSHKTGAFPDPAFEYLFWQTLVAAFPISEERLRTYLEKAMREAKLQTSWLSPNPEYESAVMRFASAVLADERITFELSQFVEQVQEIAWRSSLSETLIQLTACGVPDIYQGGERWDTRLTDPDNRAPVDFDALRILLEKTRDADAEGALSALREGAPKLWLIRRVLRVRKESPECFGPAAKYGAIRARGAHADRVVAFQRSDRMVVVAPRLWAGILKQGFGDLRVDLPAYSFRNVLDGDTRYQGTVELGRLLSGFPVALLVAEDES
jgi:(1->4)-alpha-D-glucan 1-alpha-D-glucosylmutase